MEISAPRLRPLGVIDLLDLSFQLYRKRLAEFVAIAAVLQIPAMIVMTLYQVFVSNPMQNRLTAASLEAAGDPSKVMAASLDSLGASAGLCLISFAISLLVANLSSGALAYAVSGAYLNRPVGVGPAYQYMLRGRRFITLIAVSLLMSLGMVVLMPFVFICIGIFLMLYLALRLLVVSQVVVLEDRGPGDAFVRAWRLTEGHVSRAGGLTLLTYGAVTILSLVVGFLMGLGLAMIGRSSGLTPAAQQNLIAILSNGLNTVLDVFLTPIFLGANTLFYYDLRVRKEGFDLQLLAEQAALGQASA